MALFCQKLAALSGVESGLLRGTASDLADLRLFSCHNAGGLAPAAGGMLRPLGEIAVINGGIALLHV